MTDTPEPAPAAHPHADPVPGSGRSGVPEALVDERGTLIERLGIVVREVSAEHAVATMPVAGNTQPFGLLHGGATAALAETLGSYAAVAHAGPGRVAVGIELNATHHRSARSGTVTGTARAVHLGRTLATYEVVVDDDEGRRLCTARLTCMVLDAR
ncbi:hotdog fold thioesterase [Cellulomonas sp. CW35]|uniref:hotdog fold thioesterase n=1 Tax=unclassified Cellulomonas TaxID=2620175 RepID=UPI000ACE0CD2|nr:hotdog fold thioesterase [Cellulomonas sp. PSBB021]ASR54599.1 aromatic compound degradation protein PaaI [Cellulomonas sp. PSBB021]